jgi:hypothetical protein
MKGERQSERGRDRERETERETEREGERQRETETVQIDRLSEWWISLVNRITVTVTNTF